MTRHYQDLSSTFDWLKICFNQSKYYTTRLWIVTKIKIHPRWDPKQLSLRGCARATLWIEIPCTKLRVRTKSWILQKDLKFSQQFSRPEKIWKVEIKSGKIVKSLEFFLFQCYNNKCLISDNFFVSVKSYSISPICLHPIMKKALFLRFLRSLAIDHWPIW